MRTYASLQFTNTMGLKYPPEWIRVTSLNLQAVGITHKETSWWYCNFPHEAATDVLGQRRLVSLFRHGSRSKNSPNPHIHNILKYYSSHDPLESRMVVTLACVPSDVTIIPVMTFKRNVLGVLELSQKSYQKRMYSPKTHRSTVNRTLRSAGL